MKKIGLITAVMLASRAHYHRTDPERRCYSGHCPAVLIGGRTASGRGAGWPDGAGYCNVCAAGGRLCSDLQAA